MSDMEDTTSNQDQGNEVYNAISSRYGEIAEKNEADEIDGEEDVPPQEKSEEIEQPNGVGETDEDVSGDDGADQDADTAPKGDDTPAKQEDRIDTTTLLEAGRLGITAQQIEALGNQRALQAAIEMKRGEKQEEKKTETESAQFPKPLQINFDGMDIDDDLKNLFKGIVDHVNQSNAAVTGSVRPIVENLSSLQQDRTAQEAVAAENAFDEALNAEKELIETFGADTPKSGTREYESRKKLFASYYRLQQADAADGVNTPTKQLLNAAMALAFPDLSAKKQEKKVQERLQKRNGMKLNKPAQSRDETIPAEKRAYSKVSAAFKTRGMAQTYD